MTPKHLLFSGFLVCLTLAGCAGTAKKSRANTSNRNVPSVSNGQVLPEPTAKVESASPEANANEVPVKRAAGKQRVPGDPNAPQAPLTFSPAAENSEYGTTMEKDGTVLEVRRFKDHPLLAKVELRWSDPAAKAAKFYLRSGKVVEVGAVAVKDIASMSAAELMNIATAQQRDNNGDRPRIMNSPR